jgi:hypothetical protein
MPMRQFTVLISCCPARRFLIRRNLRGQMKPAATPPPYEFLSSWRVG